MYHYRAVMETCLILYIYYSNVEVSGQQSPHEVIILRFDSYNLVATTATIVLGPGTTVNDLVFLANM